MSRMFVANFGFEDELVGRRMSPAAWEATRGLCGCWTPMLGRADRIVSAKPGCDPMVAGRSGRATEIVPWGWSRGMVQWAKAVGSMQQVPDPDVVERVNRRRWGFGQETELGLSPAGTTLVESLDACVDAVSQPPKIGSGWIAKADLGASGRFQRRIETGECEERLARWISGCLGQDGVLLVEPFLDSVREYGFQFDVSDGNSVRLCGVTELLTTGSGGYRGTRFGRGEGETPTDDVSEVLAAIEPVTAEVARSGYTGPLGIDSMLYRVSSRETAWRPLQDINARFTMGRCALEWSGDLCPGLRGTVLAVKWLDADTVDGRLNELGQQIDGLHQASRFSPLESPPIAPTGLVLLIYDEGVDPGPIECRVAACMETPDH